MKERIVLYADDGKMLTDGTIYGKQIFLAEGADKSVYYEIPETAGVFAMENTITEEK